MDKQGREHCGAAAGEQVCEGHCGSDGRLCLVLVDEAQPLAGVGRAGDRLSAIAALCPLLLCICVSSFRGLWETEISIQITPALFFYVGTKESVIWDIRRRELRLTSIF